MSAEIGNQYARKYTKEEAIKEFMEAHEYAMLDKECLCIQDAFIHIGMPSSTFYNLCNEFDVLEAIRKDISCFVLSRINRMGLTHETNATMSIWRMKQLGETDKVETTNINKNFEMPPIRFIDDKNK